MKVFRGQPTSDDYSDAVTIQDVQNSNGGYFTVVGADAVMQLQFGPAGMQEWTPDLDAPVGTGSLLAGTTGIRFRSAVAGSSATVSAAIAGRGEPAVALGGLGQAAPVTVSGLTLISKAVADGSSNAVTFSSIPATYTHLQVVWNAYTPDATEADLFLRFNLDAGLHYYWQGIQSKNATLTTSDSGGLTTEAFVGIVGSSSAVFSGQMLIPAYLSGIASHSYVASSGGANGTNYWTNQASGFWNQATPVNALTLVTSGTKLAGSSVFSLYGLQ